MIGTERVTLAPASRRWLVYRRLWKALLSPPDSALLFGTQRPNFPSWIDRAWMTVFGDKRQWKCHGFVIMLADEAIGVADIHQDRPNAVCFLVLGLLPRHRGRRLGTVAARIMLRKCFSELGARRVESSVISSNTASLQMQDGMIQEGVLRQRCLVDSRVYDEILFRLLKSEWEQHNVERERRRETSLQSPSGLA
jgi:RimJ/RimL family protein N-acetyltransferase